MSTANKLTYLNDTKQLLKQKINNLGGDITSETTFRQYVEELEEIYDNLPKTDYAEGTEITLSNTLKGKLDYEDDKVGYGDTSQNSYEGYNLLNSAGGSVAYKPEGTTITIDSNGVINASANMGYTSINIPSITLKAGTTYTFKRNFTGSYNSYFVDTNNNNVLGIGYNKTSATATFETDTVINKLNGALLSGDNYFWLYEGTTSKDFEPYTNGASPNPSYPQPIQVVTGEQEVVVRGSNVLPLVNIDKTILGLHIYSQNGNVYLNGTPSAHIYSTEKLTTFTLKAGTYIGDSTIPRYFLRKTSDDSILNENVRTFTITEDTEVYLCAYISSANTYNNQQMYWQLNKGTTLLDYEPYITPITKQLSLGDIELAKIGNYRDYIWTDRSTKKWYVHKATKKLELAIANMNNSDNWPGWNNSGIKTDFSGVNTSLYNVTSEYCNIFPYNSILGLNTLANNDQIYFSASTVGYTQTQMKSTFPNLVMVLRYGLPSEKETDTEITDTTLINQLEDIYNIMSLNGTTIVEINGNLPMIMKVRALSNGNN